MGWFYQPFFNGEGMLKDLKGIGPKTLEDFNKEGIYTEHDLINRFPKKYNVYEHDPSKLFDGEDIYLEGYVDSNPSMFKYRSNTFAFSFYLKYDDTRLKISIFSNIYVGIKIKKGNSIGVFGKYNRINKTFNAKKLFIDKVGFKIEPVYGIKNVLNSKVSKIIEDYLSDDHIFYETLPTEILEKYKLLGYKEYLIKSHFPKSRNDIKEVLRRRKYEEFYWYSLSLSYIRSKRKGVSKPKRLIDRYLLNDFINKLSYELTPDQISTINMIIADLECDYPMNRLVQGDVGCGKTIVAITSSLLMAKAGYQVACLAPTEVLAEQEFNEFKRLLEPYGLNVSLLTSSIKGEKYNKIINGLMNDTNIIVGTHSLLYDNVKFKNLGLAIIDEQHRFGVKQRLSLINKYKNVDSMFFSATPIPRTLGLSLFRDLDISSIKTRPKERKKISTKILSFDKLDLLFKSMKNHSDLGEKAYVVVPLIDGDEDYMDINECEKLFKNRFPNEEILTLHGRLKSETKNRIMNDFKYGNAKILISTTVIEVGVDIKDATMMIIMNAERFGLSTLHQLRGRVGRGSLESYCILVSDDLENERLNALVKASDGFEISEIDFRLRGPGDYLGESQSGYVELTYSSFTEDLKILECAKEDSEMMISKYLNGDIKSEKFNDIIKGGLKLDKIN